MSTDQKNDTWFIETIAHLFPTLALIYNLLSIYFALSVSSLKGYDTLTPIDIAALGILGVLDVLGVLVALYTEEIKITKAYTATENGFVALSILGFALIIFLLVFKNISDQNFKAIYFITLLTIVNFSFYILFKQFAKIQTTEWFNPKAMGHNIKYDLEDLNGILKKDPIDYTSDQEERLFTHLHQTYLYIFAGLGLITVTIIGTYEIYNDHFSLLNKIEEVSINDISILLAISALILGLTTLRAKVQSENRQKWIDEVRENLAVVLEHLPSYQDFQYPFKLSSKRKDAEKARMKLELLLNPSELDHRLLGYLLRKAFSGNQSQKIKIDQDFEKLFISKKCDMLQQLQILDPGRQQPNDDLRNYIIRVSNIIFKREWARVKQAR